MASPLAKALTEVIAIKKIGKVFKTNRNIRFIK
jgi:hypothetical protein